MLALKKHTKYLVLFLVYIIGINSSIHAQFRNEEIHEKILSQFGVDTLVMLETHFGNILMASQMQLEVDDIVDKIDKLKGTKKSKKSRISALTIKALQDMITITRIYEESFEPIFSIYSDRLMEYPLVDLDKFNTANDLLVEGMMMSEIQKGNLSTLTYDDADTTIFRIINEANATRYKTLFKFQDAFCVYLDCPDIEPEKQIQDSLPLFDSTLLVHTSDDLLAHAADQGLEDADDVEIELRDSSWNWLNDPVDTVAWTYTEARNDFIIFRVQIIAVQKQLSPERLKEVYSGFADIYMEKKGNFYQYWVGSFFTHNEALKFCTLYGENSFVVAFKGGKQVNIRDAIEETALSKISSSSEVEEQSE